MWRSVLYGGKLKLGTHDAIRRDVYNYFESDLLACTNVKRNAK